MIAALFILVVYGIFVWLIFFKLKLMKFTIAWGVVSFFVGAHLILIFLILLRFVTPYSTDIEVIQHTVQLIPRLEEPTLVTAVLAQPNVPIKTGQPLFQFDRRPYEDKVNSLRAQLAAAEQNVPQLKAAWDAASGAVAQALGQQNTLKAEMDAATSAVTQSRAGRDALHAQLDAATHAVTEARARQDMLKAQLDAVESGLAAARAKEALSRSELGIVVEARAQEPGSVSDRRYYETSQSLAVAEAATRGAQADEARARAAYEIEARAAVQVALANETHARVAYEQEGLAAINVALANQAKAQAAYQQVAAADISVALANEAKARAAYFSRIDGENTTVSELKADLAQALYYLNNTTMVAPADGRMINVQVRPGMVAGIVRIGAIASFIEDSDRYVLATYFQENLKYVKVGQPVEVAFNLYPGQIFTGRVQALWQANGTGQLLPSGDLPTFDAPPVKVIPQGRYAVQIAMDGSDQSLYPIGAQGAAAIYTSEHGIAYLRKVVIRTYSWFNYLYPLPF